jgi:hypothetical protein
MANLRIIPRADFVLPTELHFALGDRRFWFTTPTAATSTEASVLLPSVRGFFLGLEL